MRNLIVLMLLAPAVSFAQEQQPLPPPNASDPYAQPPPPIPVAPVVAAPLPPPTGLPPPSTANDPMMLRMHAVQSARSQWTGARVMNGFAGVIGIVSTGLSLSGTIYVLAAHYPPSVTDLTKMPSPSDPAQALSYVSSASAAFAFGLSAGSLGWRHHILKTLDADPGRGLFWGGTITGLVGVASIAASFIVGFSNMGNAHDQSIAVLVTSLGGSMISNVGTAMLASDATNLQKAWKNLNTF
jgi:hypothetical protein